MPIFKTIVYRAAPGAPFPAKDAPKIGKRLEKLKKQLGEPLPPQAVVEDARPEGSPLHEYFDWDEHKNSENWLTHKARQMINHLIIEVQTSKGPTDCRGWHHVRIENEEGEQKGGYATVQTVLENPDMKESLMEEALAGLKSWQQRYAVLQEVFGEVWEAVDQVEKRKRRKK